MLFRVENLGPLREAEVDLSKAMILLTGPNSTGKTYLAWSVYALFRSPRAPEVCRDLVDELLVSPKQEIEFERVHTLWPRVLDSIAADLASRLHLCFAAERRSFDNVKISIRQGHDGLVFRPNRRAILFGGPMEFLVILSMDNARIAIECFKVADLEEPGAQKPSSPEPIPFAKLPDEAKEDLKKRIEARFISFLMSSCWPGCTLLPTERTAVDLFAKELSLRRTELVDRVVEAQLSSGDTELTSDQLVVAARDVGRYPWPIQDSLRRANDLAYYARRESEFADLASEIETLLGGAVDPSKEGAVGFKPAGRAPMIGIHLTSSIVKSLVSLVFYFRHGAKAGDLLMIDEPELNLHPDNQRKIARVLAKAVNRGLRVIMSTHSDYLLRELNNLIILSRDTEPIKRIREKHGYSGAERLAPSRLGVYLFKDGTAMDVPVNEDGFEVQSIEEEINRMNAMSQEIYAALYG